VTTAGNIVNTGRITQVPIRLSDPNLARSAHTEDRFFDTSAFVAPAAFTLGNAGGNPAGGARHPRAHYVDHVGAPDLAVRAEAAVLMTT
jgi:hypothetical protein